MNKALLFVLAAAFTGGMATVSEAAVATPNPVTFKAGIVNASPVDQVHWRRHHRRHWVCVWRHGHRHCWWRWY